MNRDFDIKNAIEKFENGDMDIKEERSITINATCTTKCQRICMDLCISECQTTCEGSCQTTCQKSCQTTCQKACQTLCEKSCQTTCQKSCQETCQKSCQCSTQGCQTACQKACQDICELGCQSLCERSCQTTCQKACQETCQKSCQCSTQGCQNTCEKSCQDICELGCQSLCERGCQTTCQKGCEDTCEKSCQDICQVGCQSLCERSCQTACQKGCEDTCEKSCQTLCEKSCQNCLGKCETTCEKVCQNCLGVCETPCEKSCQSACLAICENCLGKCESICEKNCQSLCEKSCQSLCELSCQTTCEKECQDTCQLSCESSCESICQSLSQEATPVYEPEYVHYGVEGLNPGTGNFSVTYNDMSVDSPGFKLNISRTYNSKDDRLKRLLGRGWTFGFEGYIQGDNTISVRLPSGGSCMFRKTSDGVYYAEDSRNKLEKDSGGNFILTTKDQYKYGFSKAGYLNSMSDRNGNTITITVDDTGKVTNISDVDAQDYRISYNSEGLIEAILEVPTQRQIKYEYTNKLLTKVIDAMGNYIIYRYDSYYFLNEVKDEKENIIEKLEYDHLASDNLHKLIKHTDAYGNTKSFSYNVTDNITTIVDSNNRTTITWYDSKNYTIRVQDPEGKASSIEYYLENNENKYGEEKYKVDRYGNKTEFIRDAQGNVIKQINPDLSYREYQYDSKNNLILERDESGNITQYIYDAQGINLTSKIQPLNGKDMYTEGSNEALFSVTKYHYYSSEEAIQLGYKEKELLKNTESPEGNIINYTYDVFGNIKTISDPETLINTTYEYNAIGIKTAETSPRGFRVEYEYNKNMLLHKTVIKSEKNETSVIVYDCRSRKVKEITPNLYESIADIGENSYNGDYGKRYEYYPSGLLSRHIDEENNITVYTYDIYGNKLAETKPNGGIFEYQYDVLNRIKRVLFKENAAASVILLEEYFYEVLEDKKTQITHRVYFNEIEYSDTKEQFDYAGRLVKRINPDGTTISTNYNQNSTINNTVDEEGNITYFKYDGINRLSQKWEPIEVEENIIKYVYSGFEYYKDNNKKSEQTSPQKVDLYEVPAVLLNTNYEYYKNGTLKSVTDSAGRKKEYWYDTDRNVIRTEELASSTEKLITEYENNYFGIPNTKTIYVQAKNIYGNDINNTSIIKLTTRYTYDKNKNLITEVDPKNITTTYVYDKLNRRVEIQKPGVDENGTDTQIIWKTQYDFEGRVIKEVNPNNQEIIKEYNKRGFLVKVMNPDGGVSAKSYDLQGRLLTEVSPDNYEESKPLEELTRTLYTYDKMNRMLTKSEIFKEYSYDIQNSLWKLNEVNRIVKAYKYDLIGRSIKELDALGMDSITGTIQEKIDKGYGIEYKYNIMDKVTEMQNPVNKDKLLPFTKKTEYDALGRVIKETDAFGSSNSYELDAMGNVITIRHRGTTSEIEYILERRNYDLRGNILSKTDAKGNTIVFEYNEFNKLSRETLPSDETIKENIITYQYDELGNLISKVDSLLRQEIYSYDNEGRVLSKTVQRTNGEEKITQSIRYDKAGNPRFEVDGRGTPIEKTYDEMNRVKTTIIKVKDANNVETVHTTTINYDRRGNKLEEIDWRGNKLSFVYDGLGRLIQKTDPYGSIIERLEYNKNSIQEKAYDGLNNLTIFEYDKNNKLVKTTDPEGRSTGQSYDEAGNVKTKIDGRNNITTYEYDSLYRIKAVKNAKGEITEYTNDLAGNVIKEKNPKGDITNFEYGARNQLKKRIDSGGKVEENGVVTYVAGKVEGYTYYEDGKLKSVLDRNGITTSISYDIHGRLKSKTAGKVNISYTYDNSGNPLSITDATGITERKYDELNRVIEKTTPDIGKAVYIYDIITGVDTGETAENSVDPKGNVTLKIFDKLGRLAKVTTEGRTTSFEYYPNGNKRLIKYQDGVSEEYTYYRDNLLKTLVNKKADGTILESCSYTYDEAHNQTSKVDKKGKTTYTYDVLNRLELVNEATGRAISYEFDGAGNRLKEIIIENGVMATTTYNYNEQNRLISKITIGGAKGLITYSYDNNGNLIKEESGVAKSYSYDELNQLIENSDGKKTTKSFYNGEGKRVGKEVDGARTSFLYEGDKVVLEVNSTGEATARNIYGNTLIQRKVNGKLYEYLYNGHGDVTALVDETSNIAATYYYDSFGNHLETTGTADNPIRYGGYRFDEDSNLYYLNSRMYDPENGRFLQEDSYRGDRKDPLSLNLYTYCHNEPIMYLDPTGHTNVAEFGGRSGPNKLKRVSEFDLEDAKAREKDKKTSDKRKANDQRKKQGVSKIIKGIATIAVVALAVAVVVTTAGTATPFVAAGLYSLGVSATTAMTVSSVVVGVAATTTIASAAYTEQCAISDMAEGVQDIAYGQFGVNKKSTNVIRDGLFRGNTKKYETSKAIAGTVTEIGAAGFAAIDSVNPYRNSYSYESNKKTNVDVDELNNKGPAEANNLPALYDPDFAAQQRLKSSTNVTPGGRTITDHAAERMVTPPPGRVQTSIAEVDEFLDTVTSIRKISQHPLGDTITLRNANSPSIKEVVVDAATGKRVITVITPKK